MIASPNTALLFLRYADASLAEYPLAVELTLLGRQASVNRWGVRMRFEPDLRQPRYPPGRDDHGGWRPDHPGTCSEGTLHPSNELPLVYPPLSHMFLTIGLLTPHLSLFQPTHRRHPENQQDPDSLPQSRGQAREFAQLPVF